MTDRRQDDATAVFTQHRGLLFTVAYEMLGAVGDAEDVVQETWIRWADVAHDDIEDARAYLVRIVTRQSLNRLRALRRRREDYVGPWLPEPLLTSPDVADVAALGDSVSTAMLIVLETLGPVERAVFVLREVFDFGYDEIGRAVDRTPVAVRQIAHRARAHVAARRPRLDVPRREAAEAVERFRLAAETGDLQALMDVLAPDVTLTSDGGGRVTAARRPVVGAERVVRLIAGIMEQHPDASLVALEVNGRPGLRVVTGGVPEGVVSFDVVAGRITAGYYVRNPEKLAHLDR